MRRPRLTPSGGSLTLVLLLLLLLGAMPAQLPIAVAQAQPAFTLRPARGANSPALANAPAEVVATAPGAPPAQALISGAAAGGSEAAPLISLPQGEGGAPAAAPQLIERIPRSVVKQGGGAAGVGAALNFGADAPALTALSGACEPMLSNSAIYASQDPDTQLYSLYSWKILTPQVYISSAPNLPYFSYPYSLMMTDGDEPDAGGAPVREEDWFGQDFYFPADGESALIEFNLYYPDGANRGFDTTDFGYFELYRIDADGNLIDEVPDDQFLQGIIVDRLDDPPLDYNTWYRVNYFVNADNFGADNLAKIRGQRMALVFDQDVDGVAPFEQPYIDNAQVTVCPTAQRPNNAVDGLVKQDEQPLTNATDEAITTATMALLYRAGPTASPELVRVVYPEDDGYYRFLGLPDLPAGGSYQVLYLNSGYEDDPDDPADDRLGYYAGPLITGFAARQDSTYLWAFSGSFDLGDIALGGPAHYAEVAGDVSFSWETRSFADASLPDDSAYTLCFYDPDSFQEACSTKPIAGGDTSVSGAALQSVTGFTFAYGKTFGWYVIGLSERGDVPDTPSFDLAGASRYSKFVTFVEQADLPPPAPLVEDTPPPAADPEAESWTFMFYLAGDDEELTSPSGNARGMVDILSNLNQLTEEFPTINIVVQFDFYERRVGDPPQSNLPSEIRGTQRCFLQADTPAFADACRQLGELNSGDPQNLTDFITAALAARPAERTALVIMGHGNGVTGIAGDRTGDADGADDALRPWELEKALKNANAISGRKLDLAVFYACLMGNFETAAIVAPYADYMVASPNIATLVDINREMLALARDNASAPRSVAAGIVAAYNAALLRYNGFYGRNLSIAMSAFDLSRVEALKPLVSALGLALTNNLNLADVGNARGGVQLYDSSAPELWGFTAEEEDALVDLRHLATLLASSTNSSVKNAASQLLAQLGSEGGEGGLVVRSAVSSGTADLIAGGTHNLANASGLSIFFPTGTSAGSQNSLTRNYLLYFRQTSFRSGAWDELVDATRTGIPSLPRGVKLGGLAGTPGSTLQNLGAPELFPTLSSMPREVPANMSPGKPFQLRLPLLRR